MRLSDLLGVRVTDLDGEYVGCVTDVRLVQDGPVVGTFGSALRVAGLVVAPRRHGNYIGYERADVRGPWLIAAAVRWLHRKTVYVAWSAIEGRDDDGIRLGVARRTLDSPEHLSAGNGGAAGAR